MPPLLLVRRAALAAFYLAPWAWLAAFALLFAGAVAQFGGVPSYADPDPKRIEGFGPVWTAGWLLIIPAALSPLIVGVDVVWRLASGARPDDRSWPLAVYAAGFLLFAAILFGNAFGLGSWFLD